MNKYIRQILKKIFIIKIIYIGKLNNHINQYLINLIINK